MAGCSSGKPKEDTTAATAAAEATTAEPAKETSSEEAKEPAASGEGVKITMMNSKPELEDALEEAAKEYQAATGVEIELYTTDSGRRRGPGREIGRQNLRIPILRGRHRHSL